MGKFVTQLPRGLGTKGTSGPGIRSTAVPGLARWWRAQRLMKERHMAEAPGGPTVLRILLGTQLRRLREARGVTAREAAAAIRGSESKISRIELGRTSVRE